MDGASSPVSVASGALTALGGDSETLRSRLQPEESLKTMKPETAAFYRRQNRAIERALHRRKTGRAWAVDLGESVSEEDDDEEAAGSGIVRTKSAIDRAKRESARWHVAAAIYSSFAVNVVLFVLKLIAAAISGSLALISSAIESGLDLLSGCIIFATAIVQKRKRPHKYPVGRARLEPLSLVIFASVMGMASLILLQESATALVNGLATVPPVLNIDAWTWVSLGASIGAKVVLMLYCWTVEEHSASVGALASDHRNDSLTNLATLASVAITFAVPDAWWLDPVMGMVLAIYILVNWAREGLAQVKTLTGRAADEDKVADLVRITLEHSDDILFVDTVRAYYSGLRLLVEVDIVLPPDMPLRDAHDVGQSLQRKIERLESVERCFVHLDYTVEHPDDEHIHPESGASMGHDEERAAVTAAAAAATSGPATSSAAAAAVDEALARSAAADADAGAAGMAAAAEEAGGAAMAEEAVADAGPAAEAEEVVAEGV